MKPFIAPSILSADFANLGQEVSAVLKAGADIIHFDVMDNRFVPNLTIGPMVCQSLRDYGISAPIDVHLMAEPVDNLILDFSRAGANYISFHPEASKHVHRSLNLIRENNCKAGLVFSPATPLTWLEHLIDDIDLILIMSVNPGFGGQSFIESSLKKISTTREIIDNSGHDIRLEVDGGVKINNIQKIAAAGADTFVAGSAIFNSDDYEKTISAMKTEIQAAKN
ncbi:MAG: ribulose-phosphate 3-epimerase [Woeseiaceae bacterium]|nr:ribulose-phosphate 3-epimerase [Woeseiaceae bacterium]